MLPPLMPKPLKIRARLQPLTVPRRELQWQQADGELKAPLRVLGNIRTTRVIMPLRPEAPSKGTT